MVCLLISPENYQEYKLFPDGMHVLHFSFYCALVRIRYDCVYFPSGPLRESLLFRSSDIGFSYQILRISSLVCDHFHVCPVRILSKSELSSSIFIGCRAVTLPLPASILPLPVICVLPLTVSIRLVDVIIHWPPAFCSRCHRRIMTFCRSIRLFYFRRCLSSFGFSFSF